MLDPTNYMNNNHGRQQEGASPTMTTNDEPKSTVWNTIRYRARNMFGNDGRVLRIICLVGTVVLLILVGVVIGTTVNKKSNTQLRHPKNNGYEAFNWDDLKPNVQTAAIELGYTPKLWNQGVASESFEKAWEELSKPEKKAAAVLGWNQKTWCTDYSNDDLFDYRKYNTNNDEGDYYYGNYNEEKEAEDSDYEYYSATTVVPTSEDTSGDTANDQSNAALREYDWDDLPADVRAAATTFGFTQHTWDTNIPVMAFETDWSDLSPDLKAAALILGYDEATWCNDQQAVWLDQEWNELPTGIQQAAVVLGYDAQSWETEGTTFVSDKDWYELTPDQKLAATTLGWDAESWNDGRN